MAFLTSTCIQKKYIFVLLGPSSSGKTSYGQRQNRQRIFRRFPQAKTVMFLSTGHELRKQNIMTAWQEADMIAIKDVCHKLINETFETFTSSETHKILILDTIKDLQDAESIDAQAKKHGLQVNRALLFDIDADDLHEHWMQRGEDRDIFRGSAHAYLRNWNIKSNDLLNYYKKSKRLCNLFKSFGNDLDSDSYPSLSDILQLASHDISEHYPVLLCPNNVRLLLTDSLKIKNVFAELLSILKVNQYQFTLPASFVHCYRDVMWVTNPSRYHVTAKTDGVRCLLLKIQDGTYLITRKNEIYPCCIENDQLPVNTVLDGELLPSTSISEIHPKISTVLNASVLLVFDILAFSGDALWKWPFTVRQESLYNLAISKDIAAVMKQASADNKSTVNQKLQSVPAEENNLKELVVNCVVKEHKPSNTEVVLKYLGTLSQLPYPCDGLVFTPNTAYVFGPDPLLFKWQSEEFVHCDILVKDLKSGKRKCAVDLISDYGFSRNMSTKAFLISFSEREVMECRWNQLEKAWDPLFVRQDKSVPNSDETIDHIEKMCQRPYTVQHLIEDLTAIERSDELKDTTNTTTSAVLNHPSLGYSFDELYAKITKLVKLGYVEKTVDSETNLEILNYSASVRDELVSLCRGLVLHPYSKSVVTKPFVRFFEDVGNRYLKEEVEATVKYDGSLGIVFLWNSEVMVTTRRRMDSEQALWAKQWIKDYCNLTKFQAGYTYLFEIIFQNNTVIVNYLFEGLVLLAITDESGRELPYDEVLHCARAIGFFMVTPRITAPYSEILWYCGGIDVTLQESTTPSRSSLISGALPVNKRQEGWVLKFKDEKRQKIVHNWWKKLSQIAHLVHPQIVWLLVKHDKFREILGNAPSHLRVEIRRMIQALGRKFMETVRDIEEHLTVLSLEPQIARRYMYGMKVYGQWYFNSFAFVSDESEDSDDDTDGSFVRKQTEQLHLNEDDVMASVITTSKVKRKHIRKIGISIANNFVKLARKFKPYWKVDMKPENQKISQEISLIYNSERANYLRIPVLDYICPTFPALDGYQPSDNFKQTWCKGWKTLPINDIQFIQDVFQENHSTPQFLRLPVEVIIFLLEFLDGKSLVIMTRVCMQLRHIVNSSQVLKKKITLSKDVHRETERIAQPSFYRSYRSHYSWGGYGSGSY